MFGLLGGFVFRYRRSVLIAGVVFAVAAAMWGTSVLSHLVPGGYEDPASESHLAAQAVTRDLGQPSADLVVLYSSPSRTVDDPAFGRAVAASLAGVPPGTVTSARDFYTTRAPALVSRDRHETFAVLSLSGGSDRAKQRQFDSIRSVLTAPGLSVQYGGTVALNGDVNRQVSKDLTRAELISLPLLLVLLILIFRSLVAAALPLAVGVVGILGAFVVLRLITIGADVSVFALNIVTMLGLGIAVDYALFIVSRFREELHRRGEDVRPALRVTVATAGRTVAFSGLTVAACLSSLMLFPQVFLKSIGYGGVAAVLVDMVAALTVLPALLALLGRRVDALPVLPAHRAPERAEAEHGWWYKVARSVMRRPVAYVVVLVAVLLTAGSPFLGARFGGFSPSVLPPGSQGRVVSESLAREFPGNATAPIQVVVRGVRDPAQLARYVGGLAGVAGVTGAAVTASRGGVALVTLGYDGDPQSRHAQDVVRRVRAAAVPGGLHRLVGGRTALSVDLLASVGRLLPYMAGMIAVVMFLLLFLAFGSFVLPVKAIVMNVLSLGASFGVITWIFQDGHLSGLLQFTRTGLLEATDPILLVAIVFGLSMDYELFLLSRVREQWDVTGDNGDAVATGLQRSGRIITSAALLLVVVIAAFSTSQIVILKMIGVGMMVAIVVDATLVRALLVPATMRLLGRYNWWAPGPVARWWDRHRWHEEPVEPGEPARVAVGAGARDR